MQGSAERVGEQRGPDEAAEPRHRGAGGHHRTVREQGRLLVRFVYGGVDGRVGRLVGHLVAAPAGSFWSVGSAPPPATSLAPASWAPGGRCGPAGTGGRRSPGSAVGGRVAAVRPFTERVHAEPVDAGGVRLEQPARDAQGVRRLVARRQLRDVVLVLLVGDSDTDHGVLGGGRCLVEVVGRRQRVFGDERVDVDRRPGDGVVVGDRPGDPDHAPLGDRRGSQLVDGHREGSDGVGADLLGAPAHHLLARRRDPLLLAQLGLCSRVVVRRTSVVGVARSGQQHRDRQCRQGSTNDDRRSMRRG